MNRKPSIMPCIQKKVEDAYMKSCLPIALGFQVMSRNITLFLDPDPGLTLKTLYDICMHAEENHKELRGIHPLLRYECGLGIPLHHPTDENAVFKIKLNLGWNRGTSSMQHCRWNIWIPEDWREELPKHRLFHAGVNRKNFHTDPAIKGWKEQQLDVDAKADAFAQCSGKGTVIKKGKVIVTLDCSYGNYGIKMPHKMFKALKQSLMDMGLCNKP